MTDTDELIELSDKLSLAKQDKERYEQWLSDANKLIDEIEMKMNEIMLERDMQSFSHAGNIFYQYTQSFPKIIKQADFYEWCKEHGEDGIFKLTAHPQTLRAWYKDKGDQYGEELTGKGLLEAFVKVRIGLRKQT